MDVDELCITGWPRNGGGRGGPRWQVKGRVRKPVYQHSLVTPCSFMSCIRPTMASQDCTDQNLTLPQ